MKSIYEKLANPKRVIAGLKKLKSSKVAMAIVAAVVILGVGGGVAAMTMTGNSPAENALAIERTDQSPDKNKPAVNNDKPSEEPKQDDAANADANKVGTPSAQKKSTQSGSSSPAKSQPTAPQGGAAPQPSAPSVMTVKSIMLSANIGPSGGCGASQYPYRYDFDFGQGMQSIVIQPRWETEVFEGAPQHIPLAAPFGAKTITNGTYRMYDNVTYERGIPEYFELGYRARLVVDAPTPVYSNWLVLPQVRC